MKMDMIYFFTEEFLLKNKAYIKQCDCPIPGCTLLLYTSSNLDETKNVISVDFKNRKKK